MVTTYFYVP